MQAWHGELHSDDEPPYRQTHIAIPLTVKLSAPKSRSSLILRAGWSFKSASSSRASAFGSLCPYQPHVEEEEGEDTNETVAAGLGTTAGFFSKFDSAPVSGITKTHV